MPPGSPPRVRALDDDAPGAAGSVPTGRSAPDRVGRDVRRGPSPTARRTVAAGVVGLLTLLVALALLVDGGPGGARDDPSADARPTAVPPASDLTAPAWLPPGVVWRGPVAPRAEDAVKTYALTAGRPSAPATTVLLQTAPTPDRLALPVGTPTEVAVGGRPATLRHDGDGVREVRWRDRDGSYRLAVDAGRGPRNAVLLQIAAGISDPRAAWAPRGPAPLPRALPPGAARQFDAETVVAGTQPPGSDVRVWDVDGTRLVFRAEPGAGALVTTPFDLSAVPFPLDGSLAVLVRTRLDDRPREVRWLAGGWSLRLTAEDPAPVGEVPSLTDEALRTVARSVR